MESWLTLGRSTILVEAWEPCGSRKRRMMVDPVGNRPLPCLCTTGGPHIRNPNVYTIVSYGDRTQLRATPKKGGSLEVVRFGPGVRTCLSGIGRLECTSRVDRPTVFHFRRGRRLVKRAARKVASGQPEFTLGSM